MKAFEIASIIEELAPVSIQESWDNSGFSIGDPLKEVNSVLIALDCTPEIVDEAIPTEADMIITHHPLIFKGIRQITHNTLLERMIVKLIKNDIIVYSAHTNIDKVVNGVSGIMADKLDLVDREILQVTESENVGLGIIGNLKTGMGFSKIETLVKEKFNLKSFRCSMPPEGIIKRIAVCGGSGSSLIETAMAKGAQIYITGDISYHNFFCENNFMVMDIGHFESEYGVVEIITSLLRKKIPTFAVRKSEKIYNPIYYY